MDQKQLNIKRTLVTYSNFSAVIECLRRQAKLGLDTETTGLRAHHGDKIFSLIICREIGPESIESYYFNFNPKIDPNATAPFGDREWSALENELFKDPRIQWFLTNAKFDMAMLAKADCSLVGPIHCTRAQGRVEYNEHLSYSLDAQAKRIGYAKDDTVSKYIDEHKLWEWVEIPGKSIRSKRKFFDQVPFDLMFKYACDDAALSYIIGQSQEAKIAELSEDAQTKNLPTVSHISENEKRLTKVVFDMEYRGIKIDREYTLRAASHESDRIQAGEADFTCHTGEYYKASPKLFAKVFADQKDKWQYTDKGNPSFESDSLKKFNGQAAEAILKIRDAKSRRDFYNGFLWHADAQDFIHPNFNSDGTGTGRFSSSEPNFQNLTSEGSENPWAVRRSIIPSEIGGMLISFDYDQMEYRKMLDMACRMLGYETELVRKIKGGLDVHQAVAELAKVTRGEAKTTNFLTIYGGGNEKLAEQLGCSVEQAKAIREAIFDAAPEIRNFIRAVIRTAENRGYIFNWAGRRCYFPDRNFAYKAPNYLIQGGCADVVKFAMPNIQELLDRMFPGCRIILQVHDELVLDIPKRWVNAKHDIVIGVKSIMENVYQAKYLPLTVGAEWSLKSLADMEKVA